MVYGLTHVFKFVIREFNNFKFKIHITYSIYIRSQVNFLNITINTHIRRLPENCQRWNVLLYLFVIFKIKVIKSCQGWRSLSKFYLFLNFGGLIHEQQLLIKKCSCLKFQSIIINITKNNHPLTSLAYLITK